MESLVNKIVKYANLEIKEFGITARNELSVYNRKKSYSIMTYLKKGRANIKINGKTHYTDEGTVAIIPAGIVHDHVQIPGETAIFMWWHFNFTIANSIDVLRLLNIPLTFSIIDKKEFETVFERFEKLSNRENTITHAILKKSVSLEIMAIILGCALHKAENNVDYLIPQIYTKIFSYIVDHSNELNGLKQLSEHFNMHPTYISNKFKQYFGISPISLQHNIQLQKAKSLLRTNEYRVTEVANILGYDNVSSFTRFFTTKTGISPSSFIKNHL